MKVEVEVTLKTIIEVEEINGSIELGIDEKIKTLNNDFMEKDNLLINSKLENIEIMDILRETKSPMVKYYEVRYNPATNKLSTNVRNNNYDRQRHSIETNEDIGKHFQETLIGDIKLLRPIFKDNNDFKEENKLTFINLLKSYPKLIKSLNLRNNPFGWLISMSSHRKDAYLVNEKDYQKLLKEETSINIVETVEHIFSTHTESFPLKEIIITKAFHKTGELNLDDKSEIALVSESDEDNYYGSFKDIYLNYIEVRFPKNDIILELKKKVEI